MCQERKKNSIVVELKKNPAGMKNCPKSEIYLNFDAPPPFHHAHPSGGKSRNLAEGWYMHGCDILLNGIEKPWQMFPCVLELIPLLSSRKRSFLLILFRKKQGQKGKSLTNTIAVFCFTQHSLLVFYSNRLSLSPSRFFATKTSGA